MSELAAKVTHGLFYLLLVVTPVTGLLAFYVGGSFGDIHELAKPVFIVLIVLPPCSQVLHLDLAVLDHDVVAEDWVC